MRDAAGRRRTMRGDDAEKMPGGMRCPRAEGVSVEDRGSLDAGETTLAEALWTTLWIGSAVS